MVMLADLLTYFDFNHVTYYRCSRSFQTFSLLKSATSSSYELTLAQQTLHAANRKLSQLAKRSEYEDSGKINLNLIL